MPKRASPHPKPARRPTFIRAWRKHRGLTLNQLADRLATEAEVEIDHSQLSRIERAQSPYAQDLLEAIARALRCEVVDLLIRDPTDPAAMWTIWDQAKPAERVQIERLAEVVVKNRSAAEG